MAVPQPQFSDIEGLVEGLQHGSLRIQTSESGTRMELSRGQQVAVFRIVQECLTNALKHGGRGTAVRLHLDWTGPGLTLPRKLPPANTANQSLLLRSVLGAVFPA